MDLRKDKLFNDFLSNNYSLVRGIDLLLEIEFPLLFSFTAENKLYLAYVLSFKRRKKSLEIFVVETNNEELLDLVSKRISIRSALLKRDLNKTIETTKFNTSVQESTYEVLDKLPRDDFFLEEELPNTVDLIKKQNLFKSRIEANNEFNYNELFEQHIHSWPTEKETFSKKSIRKYFTNDLNVEYLEQLRIRDFKEEFKIIHEESSAIHLNVLNKIFTNLNSDTLLKRKKTFINRGENHELRG